MSVFNSVPVHSTARLCGGTNSLPMAPQQEAHASVRKTGIEHKKNDPIKVESPMCTKKKSLVMNV